MTVLHFLIKTLHLCKKHHYFFANLAPKTANQYLPHVPSITGKLHTVHVRERCIKDKILLATV